jgi:hypothetical protein
VSVVCSVTQGDFPLNISWSFNGKPLLNSETVSITKTGKRMSTLAIESVNGEHVGKYSCIGTNLAGSNSHTSELLVNGLLVHYRNSACFEFKICPKSKFT